MSRFSTSSNPSAFTAFMSGSNRVRVLRHDFAIVLPFGRTDRALNRLGLVDGVHSANPWRRPARSPWIGPCGPSLAIHRPTVPRDLGRSIDAVPPHGGPVPREKPESVCEPPRGWADLGITWDFEGTGCTPYARRAKEKDMKTAC